MADLALKTSHKLVVDEALGNGFYFGGTAASGATIEAGDIVTFDSNGQVVLADANVASLAKGPLFMAKDELTTASRGVDLLRANMKVDGFVLDACSMGQELFLSATVGKISTAPIGVNQIQTVAIGGTLTGGHFHLTFSGQTTGNIAHNANAATIQAAIEALTNVGLGNVVVAGTVGSFTITFQQELSGDNDLVTVDTSALTTSDAITSSVTDTLAGVGNIRIGWVVPSRTYAGSTYGKVIMLDIRD